MNEYWIFRWNNLTVFCWGLLEKTHLQKDVYIFYFFPHSSFYLRAFSHHPCNSYNIIVLSDINCFSFIHPPSPSPPNLIQISLCLVFALCLGSNVQCFQAHILLCCFLFSISFPHSNDTDLNRISGTSRLTVNSLFQRELIWARNARQHWTTFFCDIFPCVWHSSVLLQSWQLLKKRLVCSCRGGCACDRHVVKSHFSGILRFIIQMTSSKIRSLRQPLSSQMWTWPSPPSAPGSHYHRPLPSEEATGQDVLRSHKLQYLTLKIYFSVNSGVRTSTRGSLDKSGRLREDKLSRKSGKKVLRHKVVSFSSNRTFFVPFKLKNTTR